MQPAVESGLHGPKHLGGPKAYKRRGCSVFSTGRLCSQRDRPARNPHACFVLPPSDERQPTCMGQGGETGQKCARTIDFRGGEGSPSLYRRRIVSLLLQWPTESRHLAAPCPITSWINLSWLTPVALILHRPPGMTRLLAMTIHRAVSIPSDSALPANSLLPGFAHEQTVHPEPSK